MDGGSEHRAHREHNKAPNPNLKSKSRHPSKSKQANKFSKARERQNLKILQRL